MHREYHKWFSESLHRDMELTIFGHSGARVFVFPTQDGRFFDWENRNMMDTWSRHIDNGWIQVYNLDSVDLESWDNGGIHPHDRAIRHMKYHDYVINEVMPLAQSKNDTPFNIAIGASMGAYHAASIALRFPHHFNRMISMSGIYDIRQWTEGYDDGAVYECNPIELIRGCDENHLQAIRNMDIIIAIGKTDPAIEQNRVFSQRLWDRNVWHAFREWDGFAHDWPWWHEMIQLYIGGPESRG